MVSFNLRQLMSSVLQRVVLQKPLKKELIMIFNEIAPFYVPSGSEEQMVYYVRDYLQAAGFDEVLMDEEYGNIEATRGFVEGQKLVAINAHTDTVQKEADKGIALGGGSLYNWIRDEFVSRGFMIGGDDKCGIAIGLCLAKYTTLPMKIVFTTGEEIGGIGMKALRKEAWDNVAFCFTVDRRNGTDLISEYCGTPCAPKTFVDKFISIAELYAGIKYKETPGSWADTATISDFVPAVNLSAGYYNPHTSTDYIKCDEMYNTMMAVKAAIEHRPELEAAIAEAPADWHTKKKVVYPVYGGYTGYYNQYGSQYGGMGGYYGEEPIYPRSARTGRPITVQSKVSYKKCRIDYKHLGRDDVDDGADSFLTGEEEDLLFDYEAQNITDSEWDHLLADGIISKPLYHMGIDLKVKEAFADGGRGLETGEGGEDEYDEGDVSEVELLSAIERSGYLPGSLEHQVFTDYLLGSIDYGDLSGYAMGNAVSWEFVRQATKEKEKLLGSPVGDELARWKIEAQEERDYFDSAGKRKETKKEKKQKKHKSGGKTPYSKYKQELLVDDFVNGVLYDDEWDELLNNGNISEDIWAIGYANRDTADEKAVETTGVKEYLSPSQAQGYIKRFAAGEITPAAWKGMRNSGVIMGIEYEAGIIGKQRRESEIAKSHKKLWDPVQMNQYIREYVNRTIGDEGWEYLYEVGTIPKSVYKEGISKKQTFLAVKKPKTKQPLLNAEDRKYWMDVYISGRLGTDDGKQWVDADEHWKDFFEEGSISETTYVEGIARKRAFESDKKVPLTSTPMNKAGDPDELVKQYANNRITPAKWKEMFRDGFISYLAFEKGNDARKEAQGLWKREKPEPPLLTPKSEEYVSKFLDGEITKEQFKSLYDSRKISGLAYDHGMELKNLAQLGIKFGTKTKKQKAPTFELSRDEGLELVRRFAIGAINHMEWERMINAREIPLWIYDRGHMELKHYTNHGHFSDYMTKILPKSLKVQGCPNDPCGCESAQQGVPSAWVKDEVNEKVDRFISGKISYEGWILMAASGEITGEEFLTGLKKAKTPGGHIGYDISWAKQRLAQAIKKYNADLIREQTDVR